jgi:hypothetical protein
MDSHGNCDHTGHVFTDEERDEIARRMHALHTSIMNIPVAVDDYLDAADIIRHGLLSSADFARSDARIPVRRQKYYFSNIYANEWVLGQDANGNVFAPPCGPVLTGCQDRQIFPVLSLALVLLWKAVTLLASCFGAYEVHVTCTLAGLFLGVYMQALGDLFLTVCGFVRAPFATLGYIYDLEMGFRRRLQEEATLMRSLRHEKNTSTGWTRKSSFHMQLCFFAVVESIAFYYADVGMGFGLCCLYFAWSTTLSVFGL